MDGTMTLHTCPQCHCRFTGDEEKDAQLAARVAAWIEQCEERGWRIKQGRVSESVAAELLGMQKRTLAGWRINDPDRVPPYERTPVANSQYSYDLAELAAWKAGQQSGESWKV